MVELRVTAMENWGCITCSSSTLLCKEDKLYHSLYRTARVVCHEVSHMWVGNLATLKWWDCTWLNEGLARYFEFVALAEIKPGYRPWELFCLDVKKEALEADSSVKSHPIEMKCEDTKTIWRMFDTIVYSKGGCIMKMLNDYVGEETFRKVISTYLKTYSYSNTVPQDLWNIFNRETGKSIDKLMENWFKHAGYPIVEVCEKGNEGNAVTLKQSPYKSNNDSEQLWTIPVSYLTEDGPHTILLNKEATINYKGFIKLNLNYNGFYLTRYSPFTFSRLIKHMDKLQPIDHYGILSDYIFIFGIEKGFVSLLGSLRGESSYIVWEVLAKQLKFLIDKLNGTQRLGKLKKVLNELFGDVFASVGRFEAADTNDVACLVQSYLAEFLGVFGENKTIIEEAIKKFNENIKNELADLRLGIRGLIRDIACAASKLLKQHRPKLHETPIQNH